MREPSPNRWRGIWHFFPSLDKYVEGLKEMARHRRCRSRQHRHRPARHAGKRPGLHAVGAPQAMLRGGFTVEETGKIAGGNYMRIFRAAVG
jgi:membrane dipeptidase